MVGARDPFPHSRAEAGIFFQQAYYRLRREMDFHHLQITGEPVVRATERFPTEPHAGPAGAGTLDSIAGWKTANRPTDLSDAALPLCYPV